MDTQVNTPPKIKPQGDIDYVSHIWLIRDAATGTFRDYVDRERMFGFKVDGAGYDRGRAMAAIYMFPRKRSEYFEKFDRTLHWVSSTLQTAEVMSDIMDVHIQNLDKEIAPDHKKWEVLLKEYGPALFEEGSAVLRHRFPLLMQAEGAKVGTLIQQRAGGLLAGKRSGHCQRGKGPYQSGSNAVFILIEPMVSAAIEYLTGTWPQRPVEPAEGFHLEFKGTKLTAVKQMWLKLETGSDEIFKA